MNFNTLAQSFIMIVGILHFFGCLGGVLYLYRFFKGLYLKHQYHKYIEEGLFRVFVEDLEQ